MQFLPESQPGPVVGRSPVDPKDGLHKVKGFYPETFDRILLDPPCSAMVSSSSGNGCPSVSWYSFQLTGGGGGGPLFLPQGLRPRLSLDMCLKDLMDYQACQRMLLWTAITLLKPGTNKKERTRVRGQLPPLSKEEE